MESGEVSYVPSLLKGQGGAWPRLHAYIRAVPRQDGDEEDWGGAIFFGLFSASGFGFFSAFLFRGFKQEGRNVGRKEGSREGRKERRKQLCYCCRMV